MINTPLPFDYTVGDAKSELESLGRLENPNELGDILSELLEHESREESLKIVLEWGMQIAFLEKISLGAAIDAAMIFYFG